MAAYHIMRIGKLSMKKRFDFVQLRLKISAGLASYQFNHALPQEKRNELMRVGIAQQNRSDKACLRLQHR